MSDIRIEHIPPKQKTDELSEFLCKEMLFEHLEGMLDQKRSAAVEKFLKDSEESQDEFRVLLQGVEFCEALGKADVSKEALDKVLNRESGISSSVIKQWGQWPVFLRSFVQASLIAGTTAFVVTLLPWEKLPVISGIQSDKSIELVNVNPDRLTEEVALSGTAVADTQKQIDQIATNPAAPAQVAVKKPEPVEKTKVEAKPKPKVKTEDQVVAVPKAEPTPPAPAPNAPVKAASTPPLAQPVSTEPAPKAAPENTEKPAASTHKGFVYRIFMDVPSDQIDAATAKIAAKVVELGGRKARSVELGRKMRGGRYFHLIIPEAGFAELQKFIVQFAPIRKKSRDSHKWVIKEGQVRSILWLEEVKKK